MREEKGAVGDFKRGRKEPQEDDRGKEEGEEEAMGVSGRAESDDDEEAERRGRGEARKRGSGGGKGNKHMMIVVWPQKTLCVEGMRSDTCG